HLGRERRETLAAQRGELDSLIGGLVRTEMSTNWRRYLIVNIPLVWCGMWPGNVVTLLFLPLFIYAAVRSGRAWEPLLVCYAIPAVLMLALHAAVGNHYTRYNFILIGPYAVGAAWIMCSAFLYGRWRPRPLASRS